MRKHPALPTDQFRELSKWLDRAKETTKKIQELHAWRWLYFSTSSQKQERCSYAGACLTAYVMEDEHKTLTTLVADLRQLATEIEQRIATMPDQVISKPS